MLNKLWGFMILIGLSFGIDVYKRQLQGFEPWTP